MTTESSSRKRAKPRTIDIPRPVKREMEELPDGIRKRFLVALERMSWEFEPGEPVGPLGAAGKGVAELKINGHPAYRLVFTTQVKGKVLVLAARAKTCQGPDRKLIAAAAKRLKMHK